MEKLLWKNGGMGTVRDRDGMKEGLGEGDKHREKGRLSKHRNERRGEDGVRWREGCKELKVLREKG